MDTLDDVIDLFIDTKLDRLSESIREAVEQGHRPIFVDGDWWAYRFSYSNQTKGQYYALSDRFIKEVALGVIPLGSKILLSSSAQNEELLDSAKDEVHRILKLSGVSPSASLQRCDQLHLSDLEFTEETYPIATSSSTQAAKWAVHGLNTEIKNLEAELKAPCIPFVFFSSDKNWRYLLDAPHTYKGERSKEYPPLHTSIIRKTMEDTYPCTVIGALEADDGIALACEYHSNVSELPSIILSSDQDFRLIPNAIAGPGTSKPWNTNLGYVYPLDDAIVKIIMGDKGDNIVGIRGMGPVKAEKFVFTPEHKFHKMELLLSTIVLFQQQLSKAQDALIEEGKAENPADDTILWGWALEQVKTNLKLVSMGDPRVILKEAHPAELFFTLGHTVYTYDKLYNYDHNKKLKYTTTIEDFYGKD